MGTINKKKLINLLGFVTLILMLVLLKYELLFIGIFILAFNVVIFLIINTKDKMLITFSIINLFIYIIILYYHKEISALPSSGNDDIRFEKLALNYYQAWINGYTPNVFQNSTFYSQMLATFYYLFGYNQFVPGLLNIFTHMLSIFVLYKICKMFIGDSLYTLIILSLYAYNPFHISYTIISMREIPIKFLILIFIYCLFRYHLSKKIIFMVICVISSLIASLFHIGLLSNLIFIAIYVLIYSKINIVIKIIMSASISLIFSYLLIMSNDTKIQMINQESDGLEINRADYIIAKPANIIEYPIYIFKKSYYLIAKPFIFDIRNILDLLAYVEKMLYVIPLSLALIFYKRLRENKLIIIIIFFCLYLSVVFGIGTENYGTGIRHREKFLYLLYIIPFYILCERRRDRLNNEKHI